MADNRMVAPPGNNALEYYLRILDKQPDNTNAKDALRELFARRDYMRLWWARLAGVATTTKNGPKRWKPSA